MMLRVVSSAGTSCAGTLRWQVRTPNPDPHFGPHIRKLKNYTPETWRYRIGAWRFFYEIDDDERTVFMITAAHRGSAHE